MNVLFLIDYQHLDNGSFLKMMTQQLGAIGCKNVVFLHGDSEHTDRILQTGVLREEAQLRAIKELNLRLTALFADSGIPVIALNGHQRGILKQHSNGELQLDDSYLLKLRSQTNILISNLAQNEEGKVTVINIAELAGLLQKKLKIDHIVAFALETKSGDELFVSKDKSLPEPPTELRDNSINFKLAEPQHLFSKAAFEAFLTDKKPAD
ncbi:MAG: hypothetical protein LAT67_07810 [Balneolales bacterium]|nr:hypothetical protein [Balneolales bacterium]